MNKLFAYDLNALERRETAIQSKMLAKRKVITEEQNSQIQKVFVSDFYTTSITVWILLFLATFVGIITILGPMVYIAFTNNISDDSLGIFAMLLGLSFLIFNEFWLIRVNKHFRSGLVDALFITGVGFIVGGAAAVYDLELLSVLFLSFAFSTIIAIRYLHRFALLCSIYLVCSIIILACSYGGSSIHGLIPFIFIVVFTVLFFAATRLQKRYRHVAFEDHFTLLRAACLLLIYLSGNYFMVLSVGYELLGVSYSSVEDIPMSGFFLTYTIFIPLLYLFLGIRFKSILFVRIAVLILALAIFTIHVIFELLAIEVFLTLCGGLMIAVSLVLLNYLKVIKNGFTRDKLLDDKWNSEDLSAYIISQTSLDTSTNIPQDQTDFGGGNFGGGGAGSSY